MALRSHLIAAVSFGPYGVDVRTGGSDRYAAASDDNDLRRAYSGRMRQWVLILVVFAFVPPFCAEQYTAIKRADGIVGQAPCGGCNQPPCPSSPACPTNWICPATPIYTSKVGAWYSIGWTPTQSVPRCPESWAGSRYKPTKGYYDSTSPAIIDAQLAEMRDAGIDFVILDLTNGIAPGNDPIYVASLEIAQRTMPFAVAIGVHLWNTDPGYQSVALQDNDANFVYTHYYMSGGTVNPSYMQVSGRPLLVNYNAFASPNPFAATWNDSSFVVGKSTPAPLSLANVNLQSFGSSWWGWVMEYPNFIAGDVVSITPGADNTHRCDCVKRGGHYHYDRNGGTNMECGDCDTTCTFTPRACPAFSVMCSARLTGAAPQGVPGLTFELEWLRAIEQNPAFIVISSYNEFGDETAIEPAMARNDGEGPGGSAPTWNDYYGVETPNWYLQIATAYAELRQGLAQEVYYRDEDSTAVYQVSRGVLVYQSAAPHGHPVILLPPGTLRALGAAAPAPPPPDGTLITAPGVAPALIVGGAALQFESLGTAQKFATAQRAVSTTQYWSLPYAGAIHVDAPVYGTQGYPPAFESDLGELWPVSCLDAITANGVHSHINMVAAAEYGAFPSRASLICK